VRVRKAEFLAVSGFAVETLTRTRIPAALVLSARSLQQKGRQSRIPRVDSRVAAIDLVADNVNNE